MQPSNAAKNLGILAGLLIAVFCGTYSVASLAILNTVKADAAVSVAPVMLLADGVTPAPAPPPSPIVRKTKVS